jgi:hypothetical protein
MSWHRLIRLPSTARESLVGAMAAAGSLPDQAATALLAAAVTSSPAGCTPGRPQGERARESIDLRELGLNVARSYANARDPILLPNEGAYHQELTARGAQLPVPPVRQPIRLVVAVRRSRQQPPPGWWSASSSRGRLAHSPSVGPVRPQRMPTNRPEPTTGRSRPRHCVGIIHPTPSEVESSW